MTHNRLADALPLRACRVLRSSRLMHRQGWRFQVVPLNAQKHSTCNYTVYGVACLFDFPLQCEGFK